MTYTMDDQGGTTGVSVKLGDSALTDFILMFSNRMHVLDQICSDMSKIVNEIDLKEQELEAIFEDLYRRTRQPPTCPSLQCGCWTIAPLTQRFLNLFREMRDQKKQFRTLKDSATSYIDGLKLDSSEAPSEPVDLTTK